MSGSPGFPIIRFWSAAVINGTCCACCVVASGSGVTASVSTMAISAFSPGARPSGFDTLAPWMTGVDGAGCASLAALAAVALCALVAMAVAGEDLPAGLSAVVLCEGDVCVAAEAELGAAPSGSPDAFAFIEACGGGVSLDFALSPTAAGADCPAGFSAVAVAGADTVADRTLAVIFGDPAELGFATVGTGLAAAGVTLALAWS